MRTEACKRYGLPVAITETHLGCVPEEQARWLAETWDQAEEARAEGVDVRAVTAWRLLGLYDWCHLCTREAGAYEPGVFRHFERQTGWNNSYAGCAAACGWNATAAPGTRVPRLVAPGLTAYDSAIDGFFLLISAIFPGKGTGPIQLK